MMLLTVEGWSRELRRDRRQIARLLHDVRPDGESHGRPAWALTTVLPLLDAAGRARKNANRQSLDPTVTAVERTFEELQAAFARLRLVRSIKGRRRMFREVGPFVGAFINALEADAVRDPPDQRAILGIVRQHMQRQALAEFADLLDAKFTTEGLVANTHEVHR